MGVCIVSSTFKKQKQTLQIKSQTWGFMQKFLRPQLCWLLMHGECLGFIINIGMVEPAVLGYISTMSRWTVSGHCTFAIQTMPWPISFWKYKQRLHHHHCIEIKQSLLMSKDTRCLLHTRSSRVRSISGSSNVKYQQCDTILSPKSSSKSSSKSSRHFPSNSDALGIFRDKDWYLEYDELTFQKI